MSLNKINGGIDMNGLLKEVYGARDSFWDPTSHRIYNSFFNTDWTNLIDALTQSDSRYKETDVRAKVEVDENEVSIVVNVPGFSKEDLNIEYHQDELIIYEQQNEQGHNDEKQKSILKKFKLSPELDTERASIKLENGQLKIVIPKSETAKPKKLAIK